MGFEPEILEQKNLKNFYAIANFFKFRIRTEQFFRLFKPNFDLSFKL